MAFYRREWYNLQKAEERRKEVETNANKGGVSFKRRIFDIIQLGNISDTPSRAFDFFLAAVILINILAMFLETFSSLSRFAPVFTAAENLTLSVFVAEYLLRLWTAEYLYPDRPKREAVLRFITSADGIVELLTILPFFFLSGAVVFRMLRVVRVFHLFRINSTVDSFNVITSVLVEKRNQIASSLFIVVVLMLASSLCMYSVEHEAQPDKFANAFSGIWWSVSALLTVGYGDVYPVTNLGKFLAVVISFLGVMAVAIPTGIISAGFVEQYSRAQGSGNDTFNATLQTLRVDRDSRWIGLTVGRIEDEAEADIVLIRRNGKTMRPSDDTCIGLNDELCIFMPNMVKKEEETGRTSV